MYWHCTCIMYTYLSGLKSSGWSQYSEDICMASIGMMTWHPLGIVKSSIVQVSRQ